MKIPTLILLGFACATGAARAQGTLVFDQESSSDEVSSFGGVRIQFYGTVGQSFTPSLSTVGFVRLRQFDINPGNFVGATLVLNLRSTAINGPILGTTVPVVLDDSFAGSVSFFFAAAVPVTPSTTYFFETVVQSGDNWGITTMSNLPGDNYPGGIFYGGQQPFPAGDLWFREGIVVPEPSSTLLFVLGSGVAGWFLRQKSGRLH
jgi:hypothetical protein